MLSFDARGKRFDEVHEALKLFKIEEWSKTEAPKNRQYFHRKEVRIDHLADLLEDF